MSAESLSLASDPARVRGADTVIVAVSISDEGRWASVTALDETMDGIAPHLDDGAMVVLRNTVYPGTTARIRERLATQGVRVDVVFCPERMVQGSALEELQSLPQIVGADDDRSAARAAALFRRLGVDTVHSSAVEAELAARRQRLALPQFRGGESILDACRCCGRGLRQRPARSSPRLSARAGPAWSGLCRRAMPRQGHGRPGVLAGADGALLRAALEINGELPARIVADMQQRFDHCPAGRWGCSGCRSRPDQTTRVERPARLGELLSRPVPPFCALIRTSAILATCHSKTF